MSNSVYLAGSSTSNIVIPYDAALDIDSSTDFTIEWYQYQTDTNSYPRIFQRGSYSTGTIIGVSIEGGAFYLWLLGSANFIVGLSDAEYKNRWVHFAISRNSGTIRVFKDGILTASILDTSDFTSSDNLVIGNETITSNPASFGGYISGFNWVHGEGYYTSDFTVPTTYTVTPNTRLLITGTIQGSLAGSAISNNITPSNFEPGAPPPQPTPYPGYNDIPFIRAQRRPVLSNNLIFYKPGSLASCGVGSNTNWRAKRRRI